MEDNFNIFFVKSESEDEECRSYLLEAFELLKDTDHDFSPQWISQEECLSIKAASKQNSKIFIFNKFEGAGFEHIKNLGYRIYGPRCILSNLQNRMVLPKDKKRPIYNLAMKGVKICCTSIDKASRENMLKIVQLMAGEMAGDLTDDVTHLVAGEVGSNKYMVALANNKNIMTKEWVTDVWETSQTKHIMATDEVFKKHKCPCFLGLTVVVSGFSSGERNQLKSFVTKGGGKYSGELKMDECTHLIVKEAKGAKYEAAKNWKIRIVRDRWLYDCMDKGRYLDTKPYEFSKGGKAAKTSTPERLSVAGPHIADISNILCTGPDASMCLANESEMPTDQVSFAGKTIAESRFGATTLEADVTVQPADIFLDGCKIYLSGIQSSIQEKLKKIITAGGGFRATELKEGVTHVVMDEMIAADLAVINKLTHSPFIISSNWLMDCFARNVHVEESGYLRTDVDTKQNDKKKIRVPPKFPEDESSASAETKTSDPQSTSGSKKVSENDVIDVDMESDLMMANILSQYTMEENETVCNNKDPDLEITKVDGGNGMESNMEMTQDPNELDDDCANSSGMFYKKTFMFFGIEGNLEEVKELEECIKSQGGRIVTQGKKRQVADYGIVPLSGFQVDATVSEVLTIIWLNICLENEALVPFNHWLARPIELPEEEILNGLCICVSGFTGIERETITYLAETMGAKCQDHFAKSSSKTKNVVACTHLIVNASGGKKYAAAKNWKIPAVGHEWLEACITNKEKVPEEDFEIDVLEARREKEQSETSIITENDRDKTDAPNGDGQVKEASENTHQNQRHKSSAENMKKNDEQTETTAAAGGRSERTNSDHNSSTHDCQQRLPSDQTPSPTTKENVKAFSRGDSDASGGAAGNTIHNVDSGKKVACQPNQTDNIKATYSNTPTINTPLHRRKKKLALQGPLESPSSTSTPLGLIKGGGETPGTFQHPDFRPKFNIAQFCGPETPQTTRDLNTSTPLGEVFSRQIKKAAQNAADLYPDEAPPSSQSQPPELPPLHGVIIAVAKKLGRNHATYNSLVVDLGGDYSWQYNDSVTHFVFQGRVNDTNKEFRTARSDGKLIVSPHWLTMCKEQGCRVDESLFPHHYNPLAIGGASAKETPSKSLRATRNRALPVDTPSRTVNGKTPSRKMPVLDIQAVARKTPASLSKTSDSRKESTETTSSGENEKASPQRNVNLVSEASHVKQANDIPQSKAEDETSTSSVNNEKIIPIDEDKNSAQGNKSLDSKSQEMKDALAKTLGTVLEEASRSKKTKKKKGRLAKLSGGQLSTSGVKTPENGSRTGTPSSWSTKEPEKNVNQFPEPSQSLQVTWDDPTERLEKEKLAHRLERVCDPSQNTDDFMAGLDLPSVIEQPKAPTTERSPTPEAPSLAFPVPQPATHVFSPQPVTLLSDESSDGRLPDNVVKEPPKFLFSGLKDEERVEYGALVEELGGKVLEKQHFDPACTHLVVAQPVRNEKYLSSLAAGKWVLHKSYLEACRRESKLVSEEMHEWGSQATMSIMQNMTSQAFNLALAAHKWRKKVSSVRKTNPTCKGAFDGWKVMLCVGRQKADNFKRLLQAGGADVVATRTPLPDDLNITHAFLDLVKVEIPQEDLIQLINLGTYCLTAEYIAAYLTDDTLPDPSNFCPAEVVALRASLPNQPSRKRRAASDEEIGGNRKMSRT